MKIPLLLWLDRFFTIPAGVQVSPRTARAFRRNFLVNAGDTIAWNFGDSFAATETILPVFASTFTNSPLVIGLIPALRNAGWFLPQFFLSSRVENNQRQLPTVLLFGLLERLPFLGLTLVAYLAGRMPDQFMVAAFLLVMVWKSFSSGMIALPWQELIARVIPVSHRGRYLGLSFVFGSLLGIAGAAISGQLLAKYPYSLNYTLSFFLAFLGVVISFLFLAMNQEPDPPPRPVQPAPKRSFLGRIQAVFQENPNFRTYLISRSLGYIGGMAYGFVAVYSIQHFNLSAVYAAYFTAFTLAGRMLGSGIWGVVGDRVGHKRVLVLAGLTWAAALGLLIVAPSVWWVYAIFALLSFAETGSRLGDFNIVMEFGPEHQRPTYIGIARTLPGPLLLIAPVLAGGLVALASYQAVFLISLGFSLCGVGLLAFMVKEPRQTRIGV